MKILTVTLCLSMMLVFNACSDDGTGNGTPDTPGELPAKTSLNVAYGNDPMQKMDIYLPKGRSSGATPFIVLIHGGAWVMGDKADFNANIDTIKRRQPRYAIFNLNYRLASLPNNNPFPAQENDVKAAIEFINSKRAEFNISDKMVLVGASAGAHLAMLQGYKHTSPLKPKAIVNYYGPSDLVTLYGNSWGMDTTNFKLLVGGSPTSNPNAYFQSSPINFVVAGSAPTITFQGTIDPLVPASQQTALHAKLNQVGVPNQIKTYFAGHGWDGPYMTCLLYTSPSPRD